MSQNSVVAAARARLSTDHLRVRRASSPSSMRGKASRVGRGGSSPRPPTDPDVRISRIRLLRSRVCCVLRYPLESRADDFGARGLLHLSLQRFRVLVPPSLHGVPRDGSPASPVLRGTPTSRRPCSARLRSARQFHLSVEASGSPRFLGNPCVHALVSDPGGRWRRALRTSHRLRSNATVLPSAQHTASATTTWVISGLHPTACTLAVYASQPRLPAHHARLASGWWASLAGQDFHLLGCSVRFQLP